jgi:uncharacterized membrane protein YfcA
MGLFESMDLLTAAFILLAGLGAGAINAVVGSGTLITFPVLVAAGIPPVTATMSNALGLIPGNVASSFGYREEIRGQGRRLLRLVPASLAGSLVGAYLLLHLPETAFESIVPVLIVLALLLVIFQPVLQRVVRERKQMAAPELDAHGGLATMSTGRWAGVIAVVFLTAIYGGYFAAAQGVILIGLLGLLLPDPLQRINGAKNVLVLVVNVTSATVYTIVGHDRIDWAAVLLIAVGSLLGGYFGARVARRFSPVVLRTVIVVLGLVAFWRILTL